MTKMDEKFTIPEGILSDLCSRFIINVPEEERSDLIRIFFQIEIAHWFYLDFYCDNGSSSSSSGSSGSSSSSSSSSSSGSSSDDEDSGAENKNLVRQLNPQLAANHQLKPCSIRTFAENIFRYCPFLMQHSNQVDDILNKWKVFKHAVPTNGAIVLDETMKYVLLVQGFWAKASWGFPKGKVFEEETEAKCAIREVLEETGYDIANQLVDDQYLQININDQTIRLYIITGVSKQTKFEPRTRREIKEVRWFPIDELPVHRKDLRSKQTLGYSPNSFFMVIPFVKALKQWISIKNGNCSGQIVNGSVVMSAKSSVKHHRHHHNSSSINNSNSNQRPHSTTNHKRHDSMSQHGKHYNQHQAWPDQHYSHANFSSNSYKQLSKSNENLSSAINNKSLSNSHSKPQFNANNNSSSKLKLGFRNNFNPFLKHYSTNNSFTGYNGNQLDNFNGVYVSPDEKHSHKTIKQQSQFYNKMQQSEFNELLVFKEAALANKAGKVSNSNSSHQLKLLSNNSSSSNNNNGNGVGGAYPTNSNVGNKFKPVHNNQNANGNNVNNNKQKSNNNNTSNAMHTTHSSATILSINNNINNIANNNNTNNSYNSSRKPQANKDSSLKNSSCKNLFLNNLTLNNDNNENNFSFTNLAFYGKSFYTNNNTNYNKCKKQLEFNGPECWINFKFDVDSIVQSLPPLIEL